MIEFSGIEFRHVDNRVMSLKLVQLGLTGAAMFGADGEVLQPSEVLYKKPVLVERGSFRPGHAREHRHARAARASSSRRLARRRRRDVVELMEITMRNLMSTDGDDRLPRLPRARRRARRLPARPC